MTATFKEAYDDILTIFKAAWDPTGYNAVYPNTKGSADVPTTTAPWARLVVQHSPGGQSTLSGATGAQRFDREGLLFVQVFIPSGEGLSEAYALAKIIADAYEGASTPNAVWFRNVRVNEIGPSGSWYQVNVVVEFIYDEIK